MQWIKRIFADQTGTLDLMNKSGKYLKLCLSKSISTSSIDNKSDHSVSFHHSGKQSICGVMDLVDPLDQLMDDLLDRRTPWISGQSLAARSGQYFNIARNRLS